MLCPAHAGSFEAIPGDYGELLASSIFCLYLPGDGWSARMEDATLHGCAPRLAPQARQQLPQCCAGTLAVRSLGVGPPAWC